MLMSRVKGALPFPFQDSVLQDGLKVGILEFDESARGAKGEGATGVEMGGVEGDQDTKEVETLRLIAFPLESTFTLFPVTGWPGYHVLEPRHPWILDVQGQDGLSHAHVEGVAITAQKQGVKILEVFLVEEAECPAPVPCVKLDPGHRSLHTVPCCSGQEQQQEQLTEEKVQEAAGVEAQGGKGHAQPGVSRWHLEPAAVGKAASGVRMPSKRKKMGFSDPRGRGQQGIAGTEGLTRLGQVCGPPGTHSANPSHQPGSPERGWQTCFSTYPVVTGPAGGGSLWTGRNRGTPLSVFSSPGPSRQTTGKVLSALPLGQAPSNSSGLDSVHTPGETNCGSFFPQSSPSSH